jgi:hypothetical protein
MKRSIIPLGASAGTLLCASLAQAHLLECDKMVNGVSLLEVDSYPATLMYEITVRNTHPTDASTAESVMDAALASQGYSFTPAAPFTLMLGESVTDTISIPLASPEECLDLASADGVADDRFVNTFEVAWESGSAQCSATVVCIPPPPPPPPPPEGGATRTPGFFKTHEQALEACVSEGEIDLGFMTVDSLSAALGLLWGSPAAYDSGEKRSALDKARFLLARHTLVGTCNMRLFDTEPAPSDLLSDAVEALSGTDCALMHELASSVDEFNNSGDEEAFPDGFEAGPATPRHAAEMADDPTMPSGEQCTE